MSSGPQRLYMGVDIESGSPETPERARYSVAVVDQDLRLVLKAQGVSLAGVVRLCWERRPNVIAVDNVFELAPGGSAEGLAKFLSLLPPGTQLIQVTATEEGFVDIREAAKRAGLDVGGQKPSSAKTAFIAAAIAARGGGQRVGFSREKTYIFVTRGRGVHSGGWSQSRYQRRVRASVKIAAEKVKEKLEQANLDYDVYYRASEGGIESATFIVYAPRERLIGLVRPHRGVDYTIRVETRYEGELAFGNDKGSLNMRPVIVGIDAGMTTGLSVLDFEGKVLHLGSYKEVDRGEIISVISKLGRPALVATDVKDPPDLVKKLAAQLGAQLYLPDYDLLVAEKEDLSSRAVEGSELRPRTPHERDALAAAYRAYLDFKSKLSQVESYLSSMDIDVDIDEVKADVIKGLTIAEAVERQIERLMSAASAGQAQGPQPERREQPKECDTSKYELLEAQKVALEKQVQELRAGLDNAERELEELRKRLKAELLRDPEVAKLKAEAEKAKALLADALKRSEALEAQLEELRGALALLRSGEFLVARRLSELKVQELRRSEAAFGELTANEVVVIDSWAQFEQEAVDRLAKANVAVVVLADISSPLANALRSRGIPTLQASKYRVIEAGGLTLVEARVLKDAEVERSKLRSKASDYLLERLLKEYRLSRSITSRSRDVDEANRG